MRGPMALALMSLLVVGACSADAGGAANDSAAASSATRSSGTTSAQPSGDAIVLLTEIAIADEEGVDPIATGTVLAGSSLWGSAFCPGGTILDVHASNDPTVEPLGLIDRTITCPEGMLRIVFTPGEPGSWTIVSGTGAFDGLRGGGTMTTVYDPAGASLPHETLTGTATD